MKQEDKLENFISSNRASFDLAKAPRSIWKSIDEQIKSTDEADLLEGFVLGNRSAIENRKAPPSIWNEIEKDLERDDRRANRAKIFRISRMAAAACFLLIVGTLFGIQYNKNQGSDTESALNEMLPQYQEMNDFYQGKIDQRLIQLANHNVDQNQVDQDLQQLDDVFEELKLELLSSDHKNNEAIINAMLKNYQTKVSILERVLDKVQTNTKKDNDEIIKI